MKKIMKSVFAIVSVLTLASCSSTEELFTETVDKNKSVNMTFTASQEERSTTRTGIGNDNGTTKIWWSAGDMIKVFNGSESTDFTLSEGANSTTAKFTGNLAEAATYYAIYPSQVGVGYSGDKFTGVKLKAEQEAKEGSFDPEAAIMVAKANEKNFNFKNVIAYFKVTPTFDCSEIVVTAHKSTDALAGTFDVALGEDGKPTISNITNGNREVKLTGDIKSGKDYYILLLPGTFDYGFSVTLQPKAYADKKYFKQRTTSFTLKSNDLWTLGNMSGATEVSESTIPYITLSATDAHTIMLIEGTTAAGLQYSVGDGNWTNMTTGNTVSYGGGIGKLRLRAKNQYGIRGLKNESQNIWTTFTFGGGTGEVECIGDIRTLIDYENYYDANTSNAVFAGFFCGFTSLKSAPTFPIMELDAHCYRDFFRNCTSLISAPELPATILPSSCYHTMFMGCSSLTTAPELPAATLNSHCYYSMFSGCTSLEEPPILKASILCQWCYSYIFANCRKLGKVTMLATEFSAQDCFLGWLHNAGIDADNRLLTLKSAEIYSSMESNSYLPDNWKQGFEGTMVQYQSE